MLEQETVGERWNHSLIGGERIQKDCILGLYCGRQVRVQVHTKREQQMHLENPQRKFQNLLPPGVETSRMRSVVSPSLFTL